MKLHKSANRYNKATDTMRYRTLCGRTNRACSDGMNVAETDAEVTCKFCLSKMGSRAEITRLKGAAL